MADKGPKINTGAVVALLGFLVFFIGLVGTVGSFLIASSDGRGRWTVFYGAIAWGVIQMIVGLVQAIKFRNGQLAEDEDDDRPSRKRKAKKQPEGLPTPVVVGCGIVGALILGSLCLCLVVMVVLENWNAGGKGGPSDPPPKKPTEPPTNPPDIPKEPTAEDLGPKELRTEILGGANMPTFKDAAPQRGVLIGMDIGLGQFAKLDIVTAVQPIYQTPQGEVRGRKFGANFSKATTLKAQPGYAVGAINVKAGLLVNGLEIKFMRIKGNALDPNDFYMSNWIGDKTGGNGPTLLGGDGKLIVGIIGKRNNSWGCTGLGLLKSP
jgi:hypothetical protein